MSPDRAAPTGARRGATLAAVAAGLLLSGCGTPAPGADSPQTAVTTFFHALGDKDAEGACRVVSSEGKPLDGVPLKQCTLGFQKVLGSLSDQQDVAALRNAAVSGARVEGDRATVLQAQITDLPQGFATDIDLVRLDGRWYINSQGSPGDTGAGASSDPPG